MFYSFIYFFNQILNLVCVCIFRVFNIIYLEQKCRFVSSDEYMCSFKYVSLFFIQMFTKVFTIFRPTT
jgi:hypothetical protein